MDINERLTLNALFNEVDDILIAEMDKLLDLGVEPDIDGNHSDPRWQILRAIQIEKEEYQETFQVLGKDAWSFDSKIKLGEKKKNALLEKLTNYRSGT